MRIVFVNRFYPPDAAATSQLLGDLAQHMATRGHEVSVLCSRLSLTRPEVRLPRVEQTAGVTIRRLWSIGSGAGLPGRALAYLSFYLSAASVLLRVSRSAEVIVACTDPPLFGVVAAVVARLRGLTLVNWVHDLFPEVARELGVLPRWACQPLTTARDAALRRARVNVVLGERMADRVRDAGGEGVHVIHNWSDPEGVRPLAHDANPLRDRWGLTGRFVVMYSGNLGRAHDLDGLMEAAARLAGRPEVLFVIVGGGAQLAHVKRLAHGLDSVQFRAAVPRDQLDASLSAGDLHVVSLRPELEGLIVPSKFYGIAAAGRPTLMLGDPGGEVGSMLERHRCGVTVPPGAGELIAETILELSADPARCEAMGRHARDALRSHYASDLALRRWHEVLEGV